MMLTKLKDKISRIQPDKTTFLLQHDNTSHPYQFEDCGAHCQSWWTVLPNPLYSLDLALSNVHLFRPVKDGLCGQHFPCNNTITADVKQWVTSGADSCSSLAKWRWLHWKIVFCSCELVLSNSVTVLFVSVVVPMEINRRHYFCSSFESLSGKQMHSL